MRTQPADDEAIARLAERLGVSKNAAMLRAVHAYEGALSYMDDVDAVADVTEARWSGPSPDWVACDALPGAGGGLRLVERLGAGPIRDVGLLDSAVARPRSSAFGADAYSNLATKAAALVHSLARNDALVDGNKRLAWLGGQVFLGPNGHVSDLTEDESVDLTMDVAKGVVDVPEIATRLRVVALDPG